MAGQIRVRASLRLVKEDKLFGPGAAQLLEGVDELGSLRRSAARMEMSYNKAWNIVNNIEKNIGFKIVERQTGGIGGGGAVLTKEGEVLLDKYRAFTADVESYAQKAFEKYFGGD